MIKFSNRPCHVALLVPKKRFLIFSTQTDSFSSGLVQLTIPCYFCQCVQARIALDSKPGFGQPFPASIMFLQTALLRQHYATHFPEPLTWSCLQFRISTPAKNRRLFSFLAVAWMIHLQLLTLNQRLTTVLRSCLPTPLAIPPSSAPVLITLTSNSVSRSVLLNARHFMSAPPPELELPPRTISSRTFPPVYANFFRFLENMYAPTQFTYHSIDHFLVALLFFLRHLFSLSRFDFSVVPLFSIVNSLMVHTTVIFLNFHWFPPHLQLPVIVHELQCVTDGSPIAPRLLPTTRLK